MLIANRLGVDHVRIRPDKIPALRRAGALRGRAGAGREIKLGEIGRHREPEIPDARSIAKGVSPPVGAARFIGDAELGALARRERDCFRHPFRGLVVPSRGRAVDCEGKIAVARVRRRELEPDINRLRDLGRVLEAVVAAKVHQVSSIPEQPFLLRLVAQRHRDVALRRLDEMPAVRAARRVIINGRMRLRHDRSPAPGHFRTATVQRHTGPDQHAGAQDKPADGRAGDDKTDSDKSFESHLAGSLSFAELVFLGR